MKRFFAFVLVLMMTLTCFFASACHKVEYHYVIVHPQNGQPRQKILFDETFTAFPEAPVYEGYTFGGWYGDEECSTPWRLPQTLEQDVHIYAKWIKNGSASEDENVTVTFDFNVDGVASDSRVVTKGTCVTPPSNPLRDDFAFGGWYKDKKCTLIWDSSEVVNSDITLYAKWIAVSTEGDDRISVIFNYNYAGSPSPYLKTAVKGEQVALITPPNRPNYEFVGWYTQSGGGDRVDSLIAPDNNVTLYAHWNAIQPSSVQVTFNFNYVGAPESQKVNVAYGAQAGYVTPAPRIGYVFDGWYTDSVGGSVWSGSQAVTSDTTVYAHWSAEKYFTVFDLQYTRVPLSTQETENGRSVTFPSKTPTRSGYVFDGWYDAPSGGVKKTSLTAESNSVLYAHWKSTADHEHSFGGSYFEYVICTHAGCSVVGRDIGSRSFDASFVYDFNSAKKVEINALYQNVIDSLNGDYNSFLTLFKRFDGEISYVQTQEQIAYVYYSAYCTDINDVFGKNSTSATEYLNELTADYFRLFGLINKSKHSQRFFQGMDAEEKAYYLQMSESYENSGSNVNESDKLAQEYNELLNVLYNNQTNANFNRVFEKYGEYVVANNRKASLFVDGSNKPYSNYMDYAYDNVYYRAYTPADVAQMRNYVKSKIAPILVKMDNKLSGLQSSIENGFSDDANNAFYNGLKYDSLMTLNEAYADETRAANNLISNYFKYLTSNDGSIDFYRHVNELFKCGNYYAGVNTEEGAYTYWIPSADKSVLYFDDTPDDYDTYYYSTAFTFVHEFGHYYNGIYNNGNDWSMDHDETQSQGNEMLFLAWLNSNKSPEISDAYEYLKTEQLFSVLCTIVQATAVDEFEQAVYSNTYGEGKYKNGISPSEYGNLYNTIVDSYGSGVRSALGSDYYWLGVVVDSSAYYISYAMSALPSLGLFVKAESEGLAAARESYFKLFNFSDAVNNGIVDADGDGEITYNEILAFAGLNNPFEAEMYTKMETFFASF